MERTGRPADHFADLRPGRHDGLARALTRAITAAAAENFTLILEPGTYHLDEPVAVRFEQNIAHTWGISGLGASLVAEFDDPDPVLLFETISDVAVRFMSLSQFSLRGRNLQQCGIVLRSIGVGRYIYSFILDHVTAENCDDAFRLEGNVFEGELCWCYGRDSTCGLALGNDDKGGILSAINVWGGSYSQNKGDGLRTFGPTWQEPWDFSVYGTYLGNNGRYAINARAGAYLLKGVRMENPWCVPEEGVERAAVNMMNFATLEQCNTGGNGNGTTLVKGYLADGLVLRDCKVASMVAGRKLWLAKLDGQPTGRPFVQAINCLGGDIDCTAAVRRIQM